MRKAPSTEPGTSEALKKGACRQHRITQSLKLQPLTVTALNPCCFSERDRGHEWEEQKQTKPSRVQPKITGARTNKIHENKNTPSKEDSQSKHG